MAKTLLAQLRAMTVVVRDTGDIEAIEKVEAAGCDDQSVAAGHGGADAGLQQDCGRRAAGCEEAAGRQRGRPRVAKLAFENLAVAFGKKILAIIPGRVSTEVDARLSYDTEKTMEQARSIIKKYESAGVSQGTGADQDCVDVGGHSSAAEKLEKEGIHCNLTLLFGIHQAVACAEAGVTLISPFVGRILDWYKKDTGKDYQGADDPGVQSVTTIYNYFKKFGYKTQVMGASFRNIGRDYRAGRLRPADDFAASPRGVGQDGRDAGAEARSGEGEVDADREDAHGRGDLREDARSRPDGE